MTSDRPTWHETRFAMARAVARRSLCVRDQVGAIIVDVNDKVIGEGYNGPPRGFPRPADPALTGGWYGPRSHDTKCDKWCPRGKYATDLDADYGDCPALHAEANALITSDRTLRAGGTIYVTSHICHGCAKLVANSGLLVARVETGAEHAHRSSAESYNFLVQCGLTVIVNGEEWSVS